MLVFYFETLSARPALPDCASMGASYRSSDQTCVIQDPNTKKWNPVDNSASEPIPADNLNADTSTPASPIQNTTQNQQSSRSKKKNNSNQNTSTNSTESLADEFANDSYGNGTITKDDCKKQNGHTVNVIEGEETCIIPNQDGSGKTKQARIVDSNSNAPSSSQDKTKCSVDPASLSAVIATCNEDNSSAATRCADNQDSKTFGLPGTGSTLNQVGQMVNGATGGCSKMAKLAQAASGGFAAFEAQCSMAISSCKESCSNAKTEISKALAVVAEKCKDPNGSGLTQAGQNVHNQLTDMNSEIADSSKQCSNNQASIAMAQQNGQQMAMQLASSSQCAAQFSSVQNDICKIYPTMPACSANAVVDCSVAANASKIDCVCKVNPNDPLCPGASQKMGGNVGVGSGSHASDLSSLANKQPDFSNANSLTDNGLLTDPNGAGNKSASKSGGVPGGGGAGIGGGAGGKGGGDPQGKPGEDMSSKSGNISYGRGGGGGGYYGSGSGPGGASENDKLVAGANAKMNGPNFKKWLPGQSNDPKRNIAGVVGPDGITCSTCGTIFDKVGIRYQKVKSSLQAD